MSHHDDGRFRFLRRGFPSANQILVIGERPTLVDTGFGSDVAETVRLIEFHEVRVGALSRIVNTHHHSDHVGGNHALAAASGAPVAAHHSEGRLVNRRDLGACRAEWLDQPIESYQVDVMLADGDEIDLGDGVLQVIHTPGHTAGQICLFHLETGTLITGDVLVPNDVGWINLVNEGTAPVEEAIASLERIMRLAPRVVYPGHGSEITNVAEQCIRSIRRYERWLDDPIRVTWYGCRRIFAFALMLAGGIAEDDVHPYIEGTQWARDHARMILGIPVAELARELTGSMVSSGAAYWDRGRLKARIPHKVPRHGWASGPTRPGAWPAAGVGAIR